MSAVGLRPLLLIGLTLCLLAQVVLGQNKVCAFDVNSLQFVGSPVEQARCLLRENGVGGILADERQRLPLVLEKLIGQKVELSRRRLRKYLKKHQIDEISLGGSLDEPLARSRMPSGNEVESIYFIIHDTSSPYLGDDEFPSDMNSSKDWKGNNLSRWLEQPVAHVFVNRFGESLTITKFNEPVKKGWGTKFARDVLKADGKGLQLHIELIQPRRRDPSYPNPKNDRIAPVPGFTPEQYRRLALLYVCASRRRGTWMIPAYHSVIDAGIKDAHDDPQNFDLGSFAEQLSKLIQELDQ